MINEVIHIIRTDRSNSDFHLLVNELDNHLNSRYGALQSEYDKYNKIEAIDTVVVAYLANKPVGCACFKHFHDKAVEIKRMFVVPHQRGKGVSVKILNELEAWALEKGFTTAVLETGIKQVEAIAFYRKMGYKTIENYGQYIGNDNSLCMEKNIINNK